MPYKLINSETNLIEQEVEWPDELSDGHHTMNDLYKQRAQMFAMICRAYPEKAHYTFKHGPGEWEMPKDKFFVWIDTPKGMYGYHYKLEELNLFKGFIKEEPYEVYDGFTDKDIDRLFSLLKK